MLPAPRPVLMIHDDGARYTAALLDAWRGAV